MSATVLVTVSVAGMGLSVSSAEAVKAGWGSSPVGDVGSGAGPVGGGSSCFVSAEESAEDVAVEAVVVVAASSPA